jgi:hypothetical protein
MTTFVLEFDGAESEDWGRDAGGRATTDYCSRQGAEALKAKIETYWRERGEDVMIALHNVGFHPAIRAARFDVRSDMLNGMPRSIAEKRGAAGATAVSGDAFEEGRDGLDLD